MIFEFAERQCDDIFELRKPSSRGIIATKGGGHVGHVRERATCRAVIVNEWAWFYTEEECVLAAATVRGQAAGRVCGTTIGPRILVQRATVSGPRSVREPHTTILSQRAFGNKVTRLTVEGLQRESAIVTRAGHCRSA
jgi:hypothetical protein